MNLQPQMEEVTESIIINNFNHSFIFFLFQNPVASFPPDACLLYHSFALIQHWMEFNHLVELHFQTTHSQMRIQLRSTSSGLLLSIDRGSSKVTCNLHVTKRREKQELLIRCGYTFVTCSITTLQNGTLNKSILQVFTDAA